MAAALLFASLLNPVYLDVPFVHQSGRGCGAAVLSMVMQYWQENSGTRPPDSDEILRALYDETAKGIYAGDMVRFLQVHGFRTFQFAGDFDALRHHLEKGRPLIVCLRQGSGKQGLHYVVVAGIDLEGGLILVNDPANRKLAKLTRAVFEKAWVGAARWTLLAIP
jgi:ABC-type bacteriocin/lantibiotic exporter with double-glycine peptidase domain